MLGVITISFFTNITVFSRADGEIVSYHPVTQIDFEGQGILKSVNVKEGALIEKGQVLATIDTKKFEDSLNIAMKQEESTENKIIALESLLEEESSSDHQLFKLKPLYEDELRNYKNILEINKYELDIFSKLVNLKVVPDLSDDSIKHKMLKNKKDMIKTKYLFASRIIFEIEKYKEQLFITKNLISQYKHIIKVSTLRSPVSGIVRKIFIKKPGKYILEGDKFSELIESSEDKYKIQLKVPADEIGQINKNSKIILRVNTYDHSVFGTLNARIEEISIDTIERSREEKYYIIYAIPFQNHFDLNGHKFNLKYGMTLYATIERGNVSAFHYFMSPIIKSFHEIGTL